MNKEIISKKMEELKAQLHIVNSHEQEIDPSWLMKFTNGEWYLPYSIKRMLFHKVYPQYRIEMDAVCGRDGVYETSARLFVTTQDGDEKLLVNASGRAADVGEPTTPDSYTDGFAMSQYNAVKTMINLAGFTINLTEEQVILVTAYKQLESAYVAAVKAECDHILLGKEPEAEPAETVDKTMDEGTMEAAIETASQKVTPSTGKKKKTETEQAEAPVAEEPAATEAPAADEPAVATETSVSEEIVSEETAPAENEEPEQAEAAVEASPAVEETSSEETAATEEQLTFEPTAAETGTPAQEEETASVEETASTAETAPDEASADVEVPEEAVAESVSDTVVTAEEVPLPEVPASARFAPPAVKKSSRAGKEKQFDDIVNGGFVLANAVDAQFKAGNKDAAISKFNELVQFVADCSVTQVTEGTTKHRRTKAEIALGEAVDALQKDLGITKKPKVKGTDVFVKGVVPVIETSDTETAETASANPDLLEQYGNDDLDINNIDFSFSSNDDYEKENAEEDVEDDQRSDKAVKLPSDDELRNAPEDDIPLVNDPNVSDEDKLKAYLNYMAFGNSSESKEAILIKDMFIRNSPRYKSAFKLLQWHTQEATRQKARSMRPVINDLVHFCVRYFDKHPEVLQRIQDMG